MHALWLVSYLKLLWLAWGCSGLIYSIVGCSGIHLAALGYAALFWATLGWSALPGAVLDSSWVLPTDMRDRRPTAAKNVINYSPGQPAA